MKWRYKLVTTIVFLLIVAIIYKKSWSGDDISILSIDNNKVEIINVSPARGMVNQYSLNDNELWIPGGMGWYPASRLNLAVKDNDRLLRQVMFYNFGFWPEHVLKNEEWNSNKNLWRILGPIGWLRFKIGSDSWLWRQDNIDKTAMKEILPRDMANSKIIQSNIKINVVNSTGQNGLGNMIADRLEWWGLMVVSVQTGDVESKTRLSFDFNSVDSSIAKKLSEIIGADVVNNPSTMELVLGTDLAEVLKYSQTYVRTF